MLRSFQVKAIEDLNANLEAAGVIENKYTEHTAASIAQMHDALLKVRLYKHCGWVCAGRSCI